MRTESKIERKLATIMFTDIVGFSELMSKDETKALNILQEKIEAVKFINQSI